MAVVQLEFNNRVIATDEEGFLLDPSDWSREIALAIAAGESMPMTDERWAVVNYVRDYFENNHTVPEARTLLKAMKDMLGPDKATRKFLHELFPWGYGQQACKIAGMRKPRKLMLDV